MSDSLLIVCNHCDAVNRLAKDKLESVANCARCKERLLEGKVQALTAANFDRYLMNNDLPVVVDFWAPWCGPCKMMAPNFVAAAESMPTKARFVKVDTEAEQALGARFNIRSIPTLAVFRNGKEIARQSGAMDATSLKRWVSSVC